MAFFASLRHGNPRYRSPRCGLALCGVFVIPLAAAGCSDDTTQIPAEQASSRPTVPPTSPVAAPAQIARQVPDGPPRRKDGTVFGTSELMGTTVSINVFLGQEGSTAGAGAAMEAALNEMARIETVMSEWDPQSELSKLNDAAAEARPLTPELYEVLKRASAVSKATQGAFDVTFHGVGHLWSFKPGSKPPSEEAIAKALPLVGWSQVEFTDSSKSVRLNKAGMKIGLGAIAKGYAVDRASALLAERGFSNHVVEAGGDTFAAGRKGNAPWRVGVKDPDSPGSLGVLSIQQRAVVTSGDYMRFFEHEGKRYAHILDPKTGWPILQRASPKSVTLLANNATDADAYCTAVTVMGSSKGMAFVESRPDLDAIIIERDGSVMVSSGLTDTYVPLASNR